MNKPLLFDLYELTMAQVYFKSKRNALATFELFIRSTNRPFYVACGIDESLNFLKDLHFTKEALDYLHELKLFEDDFLEYLHHFRFNAEVWGMDEPEIVFPHEPILRIKGNLIEAQIVESALLNKINLATTLATKASRIVLSAKGKSIYDFSLRRTQGETAALAAAKYSYIAGAKGTSNVLAGSLYGIPVIGTMAHSFIMSFKQEIESYFAFLQQFPNHSILLVDTYDSKKGLQSAIRAAKILKTKGSRLLGIRLDSGNLTKEAMHARKILDEEGFIDSLIVASGNLDEYKIKQLINECAPIDAFGVGTNMGCSSDMPYTDVVYKLVEIKDTTKQFIPVMKLGGEKSTLPAAKQVLRIYNKNAFMEHDMLVTENEDGKGKKLLKKIMINGTRLYKEKTINEKRTLLAERIQNLPLELKDIESQCVYSVKKSKRLTNLITIVQKNVCEKTKTRTVFLDIDTQNNFFEKENIVHIKNSGQIRHNLKLLTKYAQKNKILILSSQDTHRNTEHEFNQSPDHCIKNTTSWEKIPETLLTKYKQISFNEIYSHEKLKVIISQYPQIIFEKNSSDLFSNSNFCAFLEICFPDVIYVYGTATELSIQQTVANLLKSGITIVIITDAIKRTSSYEQKKLFTNWKKSGVTFLETKTLLKNHATLK